MQCNGIDFRNVNYTIGWDLAGLEHIAWNKTTSKLRSDIEKGGPISLFLETQKGIHPHVGRVFFIAKLCYTMDTFLGFMIPRLERTLERLSRDFYIFCVQKKK